MFQRKPINAAVTVAIGAMVAASSAVQGASVLFPHIVSSPDVTTIVSVINTNKDTDIHYQLVYKNWETAGNAGVCDEINYFLPSSLNDIQTIDLGAEEGPGVLFEAQPHYGKPSFNVWYDENDLYNMATVAKESVDPAITALRGYLLVDNNLADKNTKKSVGALFGEGLVLEYQTGSAWGYHALPVDEEGDGEDGEFDYSDFASTSGWPVAIMPLGGAAAKNATTAFMVTPVLKDVTGASAMNTPNATTGKFQYTAWLALSADGASESPYVMYDRDENIYSGSTPKAVTCVGRVDAKSLTNNLVPLTDGGWSHLINYAAGGTGTYISNDTQILTSASAKEYDAAIIYKLDYGTGFGDYPMADGTGSFDSAILIPRTSPPHLTE